MSAFEAAVAEWRAEFCAAELDGWSPTTDGIVSVRLAAVGTIAARSVASPLLHLVADAGGVALVTGRPHTTTDALLADPDWDLSLVLSPCKQEVAHRVDDLLPAAAASGVVDTIIRIAGRLVGANTNVYGAGAALSRCVTSEHAGQIVVLGSGASSRSVVAACRRWLPEATVTMLARSPQRAALAAAELGVSTTLDAGVDVVVNTTSWGETDASEEQPMGIDLEPLLSSGVVMFDINNRVGTLKRFALEKGCIVVPGTLMQRFVNEMRVTLARRVATA